MIKRKVWLTRNTQLAKVLMTYFSSVRYSLTIYCYVQLIKFMECLINFLVAFSGRSTSLQWLRYVVFWSFGWTPLYKVTSNVDLCCLPPLQEPRVISTLIFHTCNWCKWYYRIDGIHAAPNCLLYMLYFLTKSGISGAAQRFPTFWQHFWANF